MPPGSRLQDHLLPVAVSACRESIDFPTVTLSVARRGLPRLPGGKLDIMDGSGRRRGPGCGGWAGGGMWALSFACAQRDDVEKTTRRLRRHEGARRLDATLMSRFEPLGKYWPRKPLAIYGERRPWPALAVFASA